MGRNWVFAAGMPLVVVCLFLASVLFADNPHAAKPPAQHASAQHAPAQHAPPAHATEAAAPEQAKENAPAAESSTTAHAKPPESPAPPKTSEPPEPHEFHGTEEIWQDLVTGNRRFVMGLPRARDHVKAREELFQGQHPKAIVLACADSRVGPELVFDKGLGSLFVVRSAGNIADPILLGSIEYAAEHLHVPLLVIVGHEKCGAVSAAVSGAKLPSPNLDAIVRKIAPALEGLKSGLNTDERMSLAVEANVHRSASDILRHSPLLRDLVEEGKLTIIKAVYQLKTGEMKRLD